MLNYIFAWINKKTLILAFTHVAVALYWSWGIKVICFLRSHKRRKARQTNWKTYPYCDDDHDHEFKQTYIIFSGTLRSPFTAITDCYKWERCNSVWQQWQELNIVETGLAVTRLSYKGCFSAISFEVKSPFTQMYVFSRNGFVSITKNLVQIVLYYIPGVNYRKICWLELNLYLSILYNLIFVFNFG